MSKGYFCTSISFIVVKKQMLQAANTDPYNPFVPKAQNSGCQNLLFPLQSKPAKVNLKQIGGFLFFTPNWEN